MLYLLFALAGFFLGSVLFADCIATHCGRNLEAETSDGNPGAANIFKTCGKKWGALALTLDIGKGAIPTFLAVFLLPRENLLFALVLAAPVLGHALGIFRQMHGGKCISTAFGVMSGLLPITRIGLVLAGLYILFSTVLKIKSHTARSITAFGLFVPVALWRAVSMPSIGLGCAVIAAIAIVKHLPHTMPAQEDFAYDTEQQHLDV